MKRKTLHTFYNDTNRKQFDVYKEFVIMLVFSATTVSSTFDGYRIIIYKIVLPKQGTLQTGLLFNPFHWITIIMFSRK